MRNPSILLLAASALLACAAPAFAQDDAAPSAKISLAGLDLSSRDGAGQALARIKAAAVTVCGDRPDLRQLDRQAPFERCRKAAVDNAVKTLDRPLLSQAASSDAPPLLMAAR
jgi:UrcA family protein